MAQGLGTSDLRSLAHGCRTFGAGPGTKTVLLLALSLSVGTYSVTEVGSFLSCTEDPGRKTASRLGEVLWLGDNGKQLCTKQLSDISMQIREC